MPDKTSPPNPASGRPLALVTGATGIIGPAICRVLRRDGWAVAACDLDAASFDFVERVTGEPVDADGMFFADLASHDQCHDLVAQAERELGPVRLLINNAAVNLGPANLGELTSEQCETMTRVDLLAPLYLMQAAEPSLTEGGCVVNISSVLVERAKPGSVLYSVLKAGLERMTEAFAIELAPKHIRVNAIRVGAVSGYAFMRQALERLPAEAARRMHDELLPRHLKAAGRSSELGQRGRPEDVAELASFLASPQASYISGAVMPLDGGGFKHPASASRPRADAWDPRQAVTDWLKREGFTDQEQKDG